MHNNLDTSIINEVTHDFVFENGIKISSVEQLLSVLIKIDYPSFFKHVNHEKNDFANWIEEVMKEYGLAKKLRETNDYNDTISIIYEFVEERKTPTEMIVRDHGEITKYDEEFVINTTHHLMKEEKHIPQVAKETIEEIPQSNGVHEIKDKNKLLKKFLSFFRKDKDLEKDLQSYFDSGDVRKPYVENDDEIYEPEFMKTDIPGFDELLSEGIPKGSSVLLCGGAGTGKTTFSLQLLNNAAIKKKTCLYLTFEEEPARLRAHMKTYNWDYLDHQNNGYLKIVKMDPFSISRSIEALLAKASGELVIDIDIIEGIIPKGFKPDIIILDSLSSVASAFLGREEGYRIYVEQLFNMFKKIGATSFMISEVEENANRYSRNGVEEFLADAVIVLYNIREKNVKVNAIEVLKIRGTDHKKKIVPFKIMKGRGIVVFPKETPFNL